MAVIYAICHMSTGAAYVGSTADLAHRMSVHRSQLRSGVHDNPGLQAAWTRDGEGAFTVIVLEQVTGRAEALEAEQRHIDAIQVVYNRATAHGKHSAETRAKMRASWTPERRAKRAADLAALKERMKAQGAVLAPRGPLSPEHRAAIAEGVRRARARP